MKFKKNQFSQTDQFNGGLNRLHKMTSGGIRAYNGVLLGRRGCTVTGILKFWIQNPSKVFMTVCICGLYTMLVVMICTNRFMHMLLEKESQLEENQVIFQRFQDQINKLEKEVDETPQCKSGRRFILHIGPMKTGTTALQLFPELDTETLSQDGWLYPAEHNQMTYTQSATRKCSSATINNTDSLEDLEYYNSLAKNTNGRTLCEFFDVNKWKVFRNVLSRPDEDRDIFLVDEMFGVMRDTRPNWRRVKQVLSTFDVQIVISYRRYFEWFVSFYNQAYGQYTPIIEEELTNTWPDAKMKNKRYNNRIRTIGEYHDLLKSDESSIMNLRWGHKHGEMHPFEAQYKRFQPHFPNIVTFNYHIKSDTNILAEFYCNVLKAHASCEKRRRVGIPKTQNPSSQKLVTFDMLAVAAYDEGLINVTHSNNTREAVATAAKLRHKSIKTEFPLICMTEQQIQELRNWTITFERRIVPDWAEQHEDDLNQEFQSYLDKNIFCSVDANKLIEEDEDWREWFKSLLI